MLKRFSFSACLLLAITSLSAQLDLTKAPEFWNDRDFQARFVGTYGQLPDVEPTISSQESEFLQAIVPLMRDDPGRAVERLREENGSNATPVYDFAIGNILFQQNDPGKARLAYKAAITKFPEFRRAHKNLGLLEVREGNFEAAIRSLGRAMTLGDRDPRTSGLLGFSHLQELNWVPAETAYRQALLFDPDGEDWKTGLARALFGQGKYAEGVAIAEELIKAAPDRPEFWLLQSNGFLGLGQPMRAAVNLEMVQRLGALSTSGYLLLGDIYLNERIPELALTAYREAVQQENLPEPAPLVRSASILTELGATAEASSLIDSIEERFGDDLADEWSRLLLKEKARIARMEGEISAAAAILAQLNEIDPLDGEVLLEMAELQLSQDNPEKAEFLFQRATKIEDTRAEALVEYAKLKVRQGDYGEAADLLDESLALEPSQRIEDYRDRVARAARGLR